MTLERVDNLSRRVPASFSSRSTPLSLYGSYSVSYLPSSGDQFSSLTVITQQVKPEKFDNYEVGAKWDVRRALSFTTAVYRLDRTNTRSTDPNDPTRIVQTGSQRTNGFEPAERAVTPAGTSPAATPFRMRSSPARRPPRPRARCRPGAAPHLLALEQLPAAPARRRPLGIIQRSDMFATINDTVMLPGYVRADAAALSR